MSEKTTKPTLAQRIKPHASKLILAGSAVAAVAAYVLVRRSIPTAGVMSAFEKNAADPNVEIITGNNDAFAVLTTEALDALQESGKYTLHEGLVGRFDLTYTEPPK